MAQFDVYTNPNPTTKKYIPYLLDVQNNMFDTLATRMIVPLVIGKSMATPMQRLNPGFEIEGRLIYMSTAELAGVSKKAIGKYVCSLSFKRGEILDALDFIITGF